MDQVVREYEVESRLDGCTLLYILLGKGYNMSLVDKYMTPRAHIAEKSCYCVWSDKTVTRGDEPMTLPELKSPDYQLINWTPKIDVI